MNHNRKNKIKREVPESSTSRIKDNEEHDLAYYIHDRVELMHQVFSVIKPKELKMMAPACIQHISIDDLQELCTEELLGISSKRLCAILDGADPPTDTESSSSEPLETISLDSISSDDEILNQSSSKGKKHKQKKHKSKTKHKRKNSNTSENNDDNEDRSKASRAGLTVLELLELQARARAIRAQLQQHNINMPKGQPITKKEDYSDEVEIKEEPPEVVEISSEDEKPNIEALSVKPTSTSKVDSASESSTTIKRVNDLIITVPQINASRKIKLKRNKVFPISATVTTNTTEEKSVTNTDCNKLPVTSEFVNIIQVQDASKDESKSEKSKITTKQKKKQKKKAKKAEKNGSDNDEIRLQLSDSEKMDLLEDFDRKDYESFTSSDSTSSSDGETNITTESTESTEHKEIEKSVALPENTLGEQAAILEKSKIEEVCSSTENRHTKTDTIPQKMDESNLDIVNTNESTEKKEILDYQSKIEEAKQHTDIPESLAVTKSSDDNNGHVSKDESNFKENKSSESGDRTTQEEIARNQIEEGEIPNEENRELSEGELSDRESLVNKADTSMEVLCISDEENKSIITKKKNKRKDKKSKKEKKSKKSKQDFREGADQNFFENSTSTESGVAYIEQQNNQNQSDNILIIDGDDDIYEIFELSDSSCSEVEQDSVLSKEPTVAEIAALSAKIDEIHEDIIIDKGKEIIKDKSEDNDEIENISWRDRYLGSSKVKKVLTTANLLNALRKKNKDLKTKLEKSKTYTDAIPPQLSDSDVLIEGSIDHFNTLEASTKYVDPITVNKEDCKDNEDKVTRDMTKDAKLLLKMYKKLLKHNDMHKQRDPNKKKKKKQKKNKDKEKIKTAL